MKLWVHALISLLAIAAGIVVALTISQLDRASGDCRPTGGRSAMSSTADKVSFVREPNSAGSLACPAAQVQAPPLIPQSPRGEIPTIHDHQKLLQALPHGEKSPSTEIQAVKTAIDPIEGVPVPEQPISFPSCLVEAEKVRPSNGSLPVVDTQETSTFLETAPADTSVGVASAERHARENSSADGGPTLAPSLSVDLDAQRDGEKLGDSLRKGREAKAPEELPDLVPPDVDRAVNRPPAAGEMPIANNSGRVMVRPVSQGESTSPLANAREAERPGPDSRLVVEIDNEEIRAVLALLARHAGTNILVSKSVQGTITATLRDIDWQGALEAILRATGYVARKYDGYIFVGTAEECERMDQIHGGLAIRVYRPRYVSAKELQTLLQPLITPGIGIVTVSSPPETGISADATRAGGDAYAGGDVVIVRDYESVLRQIDRLVTEVDIKPPQVAIEAMILSVRLDDEDSLGINFELFRNRPRFRLGWEQPPATLADIRFDAGLKVAFLDGSVSSFVSALQQIRDTNVIAAPRLLVLNKHRAEIQIGKEQGYVSTTITETAASQSVDFLDTGTLLRIRPFVLGDGLVRLEVHPELSDGDVRELAGFTVPQKDITQVTTNVLVPNGATVVIGGLIRHEISSGGSQIPVLGSLPWVGALFRNRSGQQIREEIIVLITPHIVHEEEAWNEGLAVKSRFDQQFATAAELYTPVGRRNVAKRFYRLAESAWRKGDCHQARRFAELALHFDPQLEEAMALRDAATAKLNACGQVCGGVDQPASRNSWDGLSAPTFILPEELSQGHDPQKGVPRPSVSTLKVNN